MRARDGSGGSTSELARRAPARGSQRGVRQPCEHVHPTSCVTPCTSTIPAKLGIAVGIARFAKRSTTSPARCAWPRPSRDQWLTVLEGHHLEVIRLGGHCPSTSSWCFASQLLVPMCVDGMLLFDEQRGDRPAQTTEQGKRCRELLESRIHPAGFLARCTGTFCLCRSGGAAIWTNAASIAAPQAAQDGPRPTL